MKLSSRLFVVAALLSLAIAWWPGHESLAQEKGRAAFPPLPKWEYKVMALGGDDQATEKELNKLGDEGWELVGTPGVTSSTAGSGGTVSTKVRLIFKRPKQ
jgi:hypothetical protein